MDSEIQKEYDYLLYFFQTADFGPADDDCRVLIEESYERETGKTVPESLSCRSEDF